MAWLCGFCGLNNHDLNVKCVKCKAESKIVSKPLIEDETARLLRLSEEKERKDAAIDAPELPIEPLGVVENVVDVKRAENEAYKFYANRILPDLDSVINSYGLDTERCLDELEQRILMFQKNQFIMRSYEQTARLVRATYIKQRNASDIEKQRKKDLDFKPFVPGVSEVVKKVVKRVSSSGKSKRQKLIDSMLKNGLTLEQAEKFCMVNGIK